MRNILFRGKSIKNGVWWEGNLLSDTEGNTGIAQITPDGELAYVEAVIPETVGEYTGLKDKEGNGIFEGDILEASHDGNHYCVYYDEREAAYRLRYFAGVVRGIYYNFVVIGNIHDNPALLEEDEE